MCLEHITKPKKELIINMYRNTVHIMERLELTYTEARANLASLWDQVIDDRRAAIIHRRGKQDVVMLPASEFSWMLEAVRRDPFRGIGKPEPQKNIGADCWSKRITLEHRLVYRIKKDRVEFLQAKYHYQFTNLMDSSHASLY